MRKFFKNLFKPFKPGDKVQWVLNGVEMWKEPKTVKSVIRYGNEWWAMLEEIPTGIYAKQLRLF